MTKASKKPDADSLAAIANIVGEKGVIPAADHDAYLTEWRRRWRGTTPMVVAPANVEEVAQIVRLCAEKAIAITPQGGNTGLVGGQIPFGDEILLTLKRLRAIRDIAPLNNTMTLEAGLTLTDAQTLASDHDRLFPLSIGSEGSCQIGGAISTNAGGVNVLRYGNMRDLVLGIEAVLPNGEVFNGLKRLRKNNTGYDLKHLLIGGEGTLGIVTAAVLKLFPQPAEKVTAFAGVADAEAAVGLLSFLQSATGGAASSFELLSAQCLELVVKNIPQTRSPFEDAYPVYVLMEFSSGEQDALRGRLEDCLGAAHEKGLLANAVIADNETQAHHLWHMRHSVSEAINHESIGVRHDVSVATSDIPAFLKAAEAAILKVVPNARIVAFGHIGDGNVHYDVIGPAGAPLDALEKDRKAIEQAVYQVIGDLDGSISAEHGVGRQRREALTSYKSAVELDMMRAVKTALDPKGIMNPGKML